MSLSLVNGTSIREVADQLLGEFVSSNTYCWTFYHSLTLTMTYQGVEGIGMSIFRMLYIKKGTWVKYTFGELKLLLLIGLFNGLITSLLFYCYSIENIASRSMYNICMGHSQEFQVSLLIITPTS